MAPAIEQSRKGRKWREASALPVKIAAERVSARGVCCDLSHLRLAGHQHESVQRSAASHEGSVIRGRGKAGRIVEDGCITAVQVCSTIRAEADRADTRTGIVGLQGEVTAAHRLDRGIDRDVASGAQRQGVIARPSDRRLDENIAIARPGGRLDGQVGCCQQGTDQRRAQCGCPCWRTRVSDVDVGGVEQQRAVAAGCATQVGVACEAKQAKAGNLREAAGGQATRTQLATLPLPTTTTRLPLKSKVRLRWSGLALYQPTKSLAP